MNLKSTVTTMQKQLFIHLIIGFSIIATYAQLQVHTPAIEGYKELGNSSSPQTMYTANYQGIHGSGASGEFLNPSSELSINSGGEGAVTSLKQKDLLDASRYTSVLASTDKAILLIGSTANKFSQYSSELLIAEGLNAFATTDITDVTSELLNSYDVVVVGNIPLTSAQVTILSNWTTSGGTLITFRPDIKLAPLMGLTPASGTLTDRYLLVHTATAAGKGIVGQTIQYQGEADLYTVNGADKLATLYSSASTATVYPAVTINSVGDQGGTAIAFTYDLAKSVIYTRQGNPEWAGQERDGQAGPIRSDDQFYPDWIDFSKVMIPQADEQQRLLANIITLNARKPVPRFWYFPRGLKAVVVMTGDDHGNGGTKARFNEYLRLSSDNSAEAVADWRAIRGTSYIYPYTPLTDAEAKAFEQQGFEIALHLNTNCTNFTPTSLERDLTDQLADFKGRYPSISSPSTNRTHCIAWSDWHTQPKLEAPKGIRLDANYYYWPSAWIQDRPGMFTGSGIPMRFADLDGGLIDCYQLTTQMTDESDQSFPYTIDQLLNKALGSEGYYGAFCANMHTDADFSAGSDAIIASAKSRNVPVISSKQLLTWLDGRNGSSFNSMSWTGNELNFNISVASGARNLEGMLPMTDKTGQLVSLTVNGAPVSFRLEKIKGIEYAFFKCTSGSYVATYDTNVLPNKAPAVSINSPANNASFTAPASITLEATATDADGSVAKVEFFQGTTKLGETTSTPYNFAWSNVPSGTYALTAKATDDKGAVTTSEAVNVTVSAVCPCTVFKPTDVPANSLYNDNTALQLGMKFRASTSGYVTGVRFYKQGGNTGTHTGQLYSSAGTLLASVVFPNETASGWQQASFSSPVAITANTTYVISYHSSAGYYSATNSYFGQAVENPPLIGIANGTDGGNGVYSYSSTPTFPSSSFGSSNYWVDVVFEKEPQPGNTAPTVAITSPVNNATFTAPASIIITASASDKEGAVSKVEFYNGNTKLGEDQNGSDGWSYAWSSVPAGTYALTAIATDNDGASGTSAVVNVSVSDPANTPPVVAISSPARNTTFTAPASITIQATATDPDEGGSVTKVEFFQQTTKLGEDTIGSDGWWYTWGNVPAGTYTLTAKATDDMGAMTTSEEVNVTVNAQANQAPIVSNPMVDQSATIGVAFSYTFASNTFTDPDNDPLSYTANLSGGTALPAWLSFAGTTRTFSGTPPANAPASLGISVTANDGRGGTISNEFQLTINQPVNQAPVLAAIGSKATNELSLLTFTATATDDGLSGNTLSYSLVGGVAEAKIDPETGVFSWTPSEAQGPGSYTFTIKVSDGALTDEEEISVQVNEVNQAPALATIGNKEVGVGGTLRFWLVGTDADIPAQTLVYSANKLPTGASLNAISGEFAWTPTSRQTGNHKVNFRVSDGVTQVSETITITVTNTPTSSPPVIASFSPASGAIGSSVVISGSNFTGANAVAFNGVQATFTIDNASSITAVVPAVATTGRISVTTPYGSTSSNIDFTVTGTSNASPSIAIVSPANEANFKDPASISIEATANDSDGTVTKVEFFSNGAKIGEDVNGNDGWTLVWSNVTAGTYTLTASATDNSEASTTSEAVTVSVVTESAQAPTVAGFSPTSGAVGDTVVISGSNFTGANTVAFNGVQATFTVENDATIKAVVPAGATTGKLSVKTPGGTAQSSADFTVVAGSTQPPVIASFNPTSGAVGDQVIISGMNLAGATRVTFGPSNADFSVNNEGSIVANVPMVNGKLPKSVNVSVTTPAGSSTARQKFTITSLLASATVSSLQAIETEEREGLSVYPNPFSSKATVSFALPEDGAYTLNLYDGRGALVSVLKQGQARAGVHDSVEVDGAKLPDGLYLVRLQSGSGSVTARLVLER